MDFSSAMARKSIDQIRAELSDLILQAVPEEDPVRRKALLVMADHWAEILRRRRAEFDQTVCNI